MTNKRNTQLRRKILTCCSLVIASLVVIVAFVTARTYTQLAVGILLYPLLIYFAFKAFPRKAWIYPLKKPATAIQPSVKLAEKAGTDKRENVGISDTNKRAFLNMIGGAGISFLLFSIFNKKIGGIFAKSLPGSGRVSLETIDGNKIDPAQSQPTDGYRISEVDEDVITFFGFTNKDGAWFVMKEDTDTGSFRYARGSTDFPGNWTNRENLKYDYFNNIF